MSIPLKQRPLHLERGILLRNLRYFFYNDTELEDVSSFSYLGIVFTSGWPFSLAHKPLARQAQKAIFKLNC